MELCTARAVLHLPRCSPFTGSHARFPQFHSNDAVPNAYGLNFKFLGLRDCSNLSLKVSYSDESPVSQYAKDGPDRVITFEDTKPVEEEYREKVSYPPPEEESAPEENLQKLFESFLAKLEIDKLDSEDKNSLLLLGGGTLATLYLANAVVGAVDSIPLVPKLLQIVGLFYTIWVATRYLLFKKTREELYAKIKDIKEQVIGSDDD